MPAHAGVTRTDVVIGLALGAVAALALIAYFGDHSRALFGASTELAGETSVARRRPGSPPSDAGY